MCLQRMRGAGDVSLSTCGLLCSTYPDVDATNQIKRRTTWDVKVDIARKSLAGIKNRLVKLEVQRALVAAHAAQSMQMNCNLISTIC